MNRITSIRTLAVATMLVATLPSVETQGPGLAPSRGTPVSPSGPEALLKRYCITCHNGVMRRGGLLLDQVDVEQPGRDPDVWEKVVRKVRAGMMPPSGAPRPDRATLDGFASTLETALDRAGAAHPNPGTAGLHRLNRTEYANAIRDLLSLDVDASALLPADDSSEGFDNVADALAVSPALLERYVAAASKISRAAVGDPLVSAATVTYRVPGDLSQRDHIEGLPLGTRGGILIQHTFPVDAEYSFKIRARAAAIGLSSSGFQDEDLEVTLNGERIKLVKPGNADLRLPIKAGPQTIGVAFVKKTPPGADDLWSIYASNSGVQSVAVTGPINPTGPGESPSRKRIFVCQPASANDELSCARTILSTLARRAFRAPATSDDLDMLLGFYQTGRKQGNFDSGIEQALARVLVDPRFVFRFERERDNMAAGAAYRVSD